MSGIAGPIIDRLFDAALVPAEWPTALDRLAESMGAVGAAVVPKSPERQVLGFPTSRSVESVMEAYLQEGWYLHDLRGERSWPRFARGAKVIIEHELSSEQERNGLPYYQELFGAFDLPWWGVVGFTAEGGQWGLPLFRDRRRGPYEKRDLAALADVGDHLKRIVILASRFRQALDEKTIEIAGLGGTNLITLDHFGRVLDVNAGAAALVGQGIFISHRSVRAATQQQDRLLQAAIASATTGLTTADQTSAETLVIGRPGTSPLLLDVVSLPGVARDVFTRAVAVLIIRTVEVQPSATRQLLEQMFGLTPAEARLALLVGSGRALADIGDELGIARETARTVLKRVFHKVGVSRQAELAAVLGRLAKR